MNEAWIANELKRAHRSVGRMKPKNDDHALAQSAQSGMDRKPGLVRMNRILKQHVEHCLIPKNLRIARQLWPGNMRQGLFVGGEGPVRFERYSSFGNPWTGETSVAFVNLNRVGDP